MVGPSWILVVGKVGVAGDGRVAFGLIELCVLMKSQYCFFKLKIMLIKMCTSCTCTCVLKSEHNQEPQWIGII